MNVSNASFSEFPLENGVLADMSGDEFPTVLSAWKNNVLELGSGATHFGFVHSGVVSVKCASGMFNLGAGMYFSIPGSAVLSGASEGIVISRRAYNGFFQIGGPVEPSGRLRYIDGCTDSLLVPPVMMGDPCLNLLCFPSGVDQTSHTHPSMRVGMVVSGKGICRTPQGNIPLVPGQVFVIHAHKLHAFSTADEGMRVIAYHPDSDFGPTHQNHPMINRTIVDGMPAAQLEHLQTREAVSYEMA